MKKMKKVFAILLAMVMVIAMAIPSFAATSTTSPWTSNITVNGLTKEAVTTVNFYKVISYDGTDWAITDGMESYVTVNADGTFTVDWDSIKTYVEEKSIEANYTQTAAKGTDSVTQAVPVGAYLILATDEGGETVYNVLGAETYAEDETYLTSEDVEVTAKTSTNKLDKTADDNFVAKGQTVHFTITTTFPAIEYTSTKTTATYKIVDTPTGLNITAMELDKNCTVAAPTSTANSNGTWTMQWDLTDSDNTNAGKQVVINVTATVTSDTGYKQTANAYRDNENIGGDEEDGFSGDITLTKYNKDESEILSGAEFEVKKLISAAVEDDPSTEDDEAANAVYETLSFVYVSDGVYKLAGGVTGETTTTTVVATNGTVKITGLDEGTYYFHETKAPSGYSLNDKDTEVTITESNSSVSVDNAKMVDTKLSSLPSTGGIGTTIFTVAGCAIIVVAGGLLIVSRRKKSA